MKLALAILAYFGMGTVLAWGILLLMAGKPWLLIVGSLTYLLALARIGCRTH